MSQETNKNQYGKILASWVFPEHAEYQRGRAWYITMSLIFLALAIYALWTENYLFFFILILFVLIFYITARNKKNITFQIAQAGILIGSRFYEYSSIRDFWIVYRPPDVKMLYFHLKKIFFQDISVPLLDQNPVEIRRLLLKYIDEDTEKEDMPFFDDLSRMLKL